MQCNQCKKEFQAARADAKFCGDACRKAYSRIISDKSQIISDKSDNKSDILSEINDNKSDKIISDKTENLSLELSKLTAEQLYAAINSYVADSWAESPEYKELIRRLKKYSVKELRMQGFQIPVWKLNGAPCPL